MLDFNYMVSTKILFGKNKIKQLGEELQQYGNKVLFVYGQGYIKKIGVYNAVTDIFTRNFIIFYELPGIQPNPQISHVRQGIKLCKDHDIDVIIGVGGGSVIDCALNNT